MYQFSKRRAAALISLHLAVLRDDREFRNESRGFLIVRRGKTVRGEKERGNASGIPREVGGAGNLEPSLIRV